MTTRNHSGHSLANLRAFMERQQREQSQSFQNINTPSSNPVPAALVVPSQPLSPPEDHQQTQRNSGSTLVPLYNSCASRPFATYSPYTTMPSTQARSSQVPVAHMYGGQRSAPSPVPQNATISPTWRPGNTATGAASNAEAMECIRQFHQSSIFPQMTLSSTSGFGAGSPPPTASTPAVSTSRFSPLTASMMLSGEISRPSRVMPMNPLQTRHMPVPHISTPSPQQGNLDQRRGSIATFTSGSTPQRPSSRPHSVPLQQTAGLDPCSQIEGQQRRPSVGSGHAYGQGGPGAPSPTTPLMGMAPTPPPRQQMANAGPVQIPNLPVVLSRGTEVLAGQNTPISSSFRRPSVEESLGYHEITHVQRPQCPSGLNTQLSGTPTSATPRSPPTLGKHAREDAATCTAYTNGPPPKKGPMAPSPVPAHRDGPVNVNRRLSQEAAKHGVDNLAISSPHVQGRINTIDPTDVLTNVQGHTSQEQARTIQAIRKQAVASTPMGPPPRPVQKSDVNASTAVPNTTNLNRPPPPARPRQTSVVNASSTSPQTHNPVRLPPPPRPLQTNDANANTTSTYATKPVRQPPQSRPLHTNDVNARRTSPCATSPAQPPRPHNTSPAKKRLLEETDLSWPLDPTILLKATKKQKINPPAESTTFQKGNSMGVQMLQVEYGPWNKKEIDAYASVPHRFGHLPVDPDLLADSSSSSSSSRSTQASTGVNTSAQAGSSAQTSAQTSTNANNSTQASTNANSSTQANTNAKSSTQASTSDTTQARRGPPSQPSTTQMPVSVPPSDNPTGNIFDGPRPSPSPHPQPTTHQVPLITHSPPTLRTPSTPQTMSAPWPGLGKCTVDAEGVLRASEAPWTQERVCVEIALQEFERESSGRTWVRRRDGEWVLVAAVKAWGTAEGMLPLGERWGLGEGVECVK